MNAKELGYQIGQVAAPIILIGLAIYAGRKMGQKRNPPTFVAWPVAVAILLTFSVVALKLQKKAQAERPTFGTLQIKDRVRVAHGREEPTSVHARARVDTL